MRKQSLETKVHSKNHTFMQLYIIYFDTAPPPNVAIFYSVLF